MSTNRALAPDTMFQKQLAFGRIAETDIARWIISRGGIILPIYDIEYEDEIPKGPRVFGNGRSWAAPDLLVYRQGNLTWIEAKHKSVFSWYYTKKRWETGIDLHHYEQYQEVQRVFGQSCWLLFLHRCHLPNPKDLARGCPKECPTGLFGESMDVLSRCESHRDSHHRKNGGRHGMVYWAYENLRQLATLDEIRMSSNTG